MDVERTIEFLLQQHSNFEARKAASEERFDAQIAKINEIHAETSEIARKTRLELRRAVRLGIQEARAERKRRHEADERLAALGASLKSFIDSMQPPRNGHGLPPAV